MSPTFDSFAKQLRAARRGKGVTQSALAVQVGCKQSAISMLEDGKPDAVNRETLERIAALFELTPPAVDEKTFTITPAATKAAMCYCPQADCYSNIPFVVQGQLKYHPRRQLSMNGAPYCAVCGELLETTCPNCGASYTEGACCTHCGHSYIAPTTSQIQQAEQPDGIDQLATWADQRRREIADWRGQLNG